MLKGQNRLSRRTLLTGLGVLGIAGWSGYQLMAEESTAAILPAMQRGKVSSPVLFDRQRLMQHIAMLAQPEWNGRMAGSSGEAKAGEYIAREWQRYGLQPAGEGGTFFQSFPLPVLTLTSAGGRMRLAAGGVSDKKGDNLLALVPGRHPEKWQELVVVSCHYDHLGRWGNDLYPGANDNASGVAVVLELARRMVQKPPKRTVAFLAFSGEEAGLIGSRYFVAHPTLALEQVVAVLNLDSIGNFTEEYTYWAPESLPWRSLLTDHAEAVGIRLTEAAMNGHASDHLAFVEQGIPAVTVLAANWLEHNHTPRDLPEHVDPEGIMTIARWAWQVIMELAEGAR
ncbi:M28 family metallopeptidase [Heliophilum fasciatum]|uniref:Peptidase M28-like protein n=1 Tax=Heliophilum fasciatum TaxID=35700 RepID=A0A4V2SW86_9FIRM|nr:M20/M25/M40 family metallo-hydrolase [Heliophilum fasciatum]MCW2279089.1 hypothetical protein [Heliophilum fasciatum]TCP61486.1 peptidase M28-like protein [Heliophilum fasciatum]